MPDSRTPDEIERDIERERAELGRTVDELQSRLSPDHIMREIGRGLSDHGADIGTAITQSVKRNPMALAITGIGLAWLMSGRSWDPEARVEPGYADGTRALPAPAAPSRAPAYPSRGALTREPFDDRVGYGAYPETGGLAEEDDWLWADDDAYWDDWDEWDEADDANDGPGLGQRIGDAATSAGDGARDAASRAGSGLKSAARSVGDRASAAANRVGTAAGDARDATSSGLNSLGESVASAGSSVAARGRRIRRRLARGTEALSHEARERVIAARWAAVKARRSASRKVRKGAETASDFYHENPLVVGGLALAAGAVLAGALPRTRQEDSYFGAYSDDAYDTAERALRDEAHKAKRVARKAAATAREVLEEERAKIDGQAPGEKSAVEHVVDEVRDGVSRVTEATREEADRQKLGSPGS